LLFICFDTTGTINFHFNAGYLELRNVTVCELHIGYRNHMQPSMIGD